MARIHRTEVTCPHCGSSQSEPQAAVSTYCRSCGKHFDIGTAARSAPVARVPASGSRVPGKRVHCYKCRGEHGVSHFAKTTLCPSCGTFIELGNLTISANASRPVDIRGHLDIRSGANLNNSWVVCRSAEIEGTLTGTLLCEEGLVLSGPGRLSFRAYAGDVLVTKNVRVEMGFPLVTTLLDVRGALSGPVLCAGLVRVHKGAELIGEVHARSLIVEKGATFRGRTHIASDHGQIPPLPPGIASSQ
jgi:endogenous inhibitor of DNA gyrase (YacG/DUF329 family)